jgi:hypothetical protein
MDYQFVGFVFACIGAVVAVLYLVLGFNLLEFLKRQHESKSGDGTRN